MRELPAANEELVSIVMPAFNSAATVGRALASVGAQTWPHREVIVVDDGSTDATAPIVQGVAAADPRVELIGLQRNGGVAAARNVGVARARGAWLLFVDADDTMDSGHVEHLLAAARSSGARLVRSSWCAVDADGVTGRIYEAKPIGDLFAHSAPGPAFQTSELLMRTADVRGVGLFDSGLSWGEDWDLWTRLGRLVPHCAAAPDALTYYHLRERGAAGPFDQWLEDGLRVLSRASAPDPRVPATAPGATRTLPPSQLATARNRLILGNCGIRIAAGAPLETVTRRLDRSAAAMMDVEEIAAQLLSGVAFGAGATYDGLPQQWGPLRAKLQAALPMIRRSLGDLCPDDTLVRAICYAATDGALPTRLPMALPPVLAARVTLAEPPRPLAMPDGVTTARVYVATGGERGRPVDLPVTGVQVPATAVAAAALDLEDGGGVRRYLGAVWWRPRILVRLGRAALASRSGWALAAHYLLRKPGRGQALKAWLRAHAVELVPLYAAVAGDRRRDTPR